MILDVSTINLNNISNIKFLLKQFQEIASPTNQKILQSINTTEEIQERNVQKKLFMIVDNESAAERLRGLEVRPSCFLLRPLDLSKLN